MLCAIFARCSRVQSATKGNDALCFWGSGGGSGTDASKDDDDDLSKVVAKLGDAFTSKVRLVR